MQNSNNRIIYSFTTFNSSYILPARVSFASIKKNKGNELLHVYILHFSLLPEEIQLLESDSTDTFIIKCIKVSEKEIPDIKLYFHLTKEVNLKVLAYRYLPKEINKIIYFDVDTIILRSFVELFDLDISNKYFVCYKDQKINSKELDRLQLPHNFEYACAGVMLMNLEKMRSNISYENRILEFFRKCKLKLSFLEQDMINLVFTQTDEVSVIGYPYRFNRFVDTIRKRQISKEKIGLIHYEGPHLKPWKGSATRHYMLWWKYAWSIKEYRRQFWIIFPTYTKNLVNKIFAKIGLILGIKKINK